MFDEILGGVFPKYSQAVSISLIFSIHQNADCLNKPTMFIVFCQVLWEN